MRKASVIVLLSLVATVAVARERTRWIYYSKPVYKPRANAAWAEKGRIVGPIVRCPGCKIEVRDAKGKVVKSLTIPKGNKAYEAEWLVPGVYVLHVTAEGYKPLTLDELEVRIKNDLWIAIEFQ